MNNNNIVSLFQKGESLLEIMRQRILFLFQEGASLLFITLDTYPFDGERSLTKNKKFLKHLFTVIETIELKYKIKLCTRLREGESFPNRIMTLYNDGLSAKEITCELWEPWDIPESQPYFQSFEEIILSIVND